jgi:hypothetical protein
MSTIINPMDLDINVFMVLLSLRNNSAKLKHNRLKMKIPLNNKRDITTKPTAHELYFKTK